ncbi:hypothetical protein KP509_17G079100 [Ceratopteris richardii]|uniref:BHLH domain-containing protein n=1 Tax=Ceratopteris richardii TaxID=49495 RepID=A0A8T2SZA9_CERRI|nr:hypothetical protein KP509_17G079100 [Ceratopteris richardii]KAH7373897.1 hypothetical protein KP509_17G079100 [Ceratopteris richardii]KAH7373898.1 hypothetical protein KP509_17G079100 [Ceratopteris richardii]KAH7373899.1 hypothetical protein KP509_17G079100 [Ceratopteris richardii]KAH7373900.1 hypothetical protein KP509_17G079100 [Ceratopteris richardii]
MDVDSSLFQAYMSGASHTHVAPKVFAPLSGGLMRYHSAPSCVLASLLDEDYFEESNTESEFSRLLSDGIASLSTLLDSKTDTSEAQSSSELCTIKQEDDFLVDDLLDKQSSSPPGTDVRFSERRSPGHLPSISEHEDPGPDLSVPVLTGAVKQPPYEGSRSGVIHIQTQLYDSALIRQNNTSAEAFSCLTIDDIGGKAKNAVCSSILPPCPVVDGGGVSPRTLPPLRVSAMPRTPNVNCSSGVDTFSSSTRQAPSALLRHSSSPAGLLSQINIEELIMAKEGGSTVAGGRPPSLVCDGLNRQTIWGLADPAHQRKRGRASSEKTLMGLQKSPEVTSASLSPTSGSTDQAETSGGEDFVLCRARAKRGCATHPRSIAERQRRIKINERMKKLQDLVPNLDKQASTAEMLDEVVEYVKLLQRKVQELTLNPPKCMGSCSHAGSSSS